jgi:hypothetical protein
VKSDQQNTSNVVHCRFRASGARHDRNEDTASVESDISRLIDLSRYEEPTRRSDDFRSRMAVNIAVLVLLVTLAAVAALDVLDIEEIERGAPAPQCGLAANRDC